MAGRLIRTLVFGFAAALAACTEMTPPTAPPVETAAETASPATFTPSAESVALKAYFQSVENFYRTQGNLRTDGGGRDTPFDTRRITDAFMNIAFYNEFVARAGKSVQQKSPATLVRWVSPLKVSVEFGQALSPIQIARDQRDTLSFLARLSRLSGLPVGQTDANNANVRILFLNEDERRAALPDLQAFIGNVDGGMVSALRDPQKSTYCFALTVDSNDDRIIEKALVIIRAETPNLLQLSCIQEELAQMMGLTNDDPAARPSIFNDDQEFATLTRMDEYLMRILYDARLRPGMTETEARGTVETIASGLLAGDRGS